MALGAVESVCWVWLIMNVLAFLYMHAYFATLILSKPRHNRLIYYIIYTSCSWHVHTYLRLTSQVKLLLATMDTGGGLNFETCLWCIYFHCSTAFNQHHDDSPKPCTLTFSRFTLWIWPTAQWPYQLFKAVHTDSCSTGMTQVCTLFTSCLEAHERWLIWPTHSNIHISTCYS